MQKVGAKMVPKILTFEQQEPRKNVCTDTLNAIENDPNLLERIITCDESWFFTYDPETKRQSMHWKSPSSSRQKKAKSGKVYHTYNTYIFMIENKPIITTFPYLSFQS